MAERLCTNCGLRPPEPRNCFCSICVEHFRTQHEAKRGLCVSCRMFEKEPNKGVCFHCMVRQTPTLTRRCDNCQWPGVPSGHSLCDVCETMFQVLAFKPYWTNLVKEHNALVQRLLHPNQEGGML